MPLKELKEELVSYIENTNDAELLALLKEDFMFYGKKMILILPTTLV